MEDKEIREEGVSPEILEASAGEAEAIPEESRAEGEAAPAESAAAAEETPGEEAPEPTTTVDDILAPTEPAAEAVPADEAQLNLQAVIEAIVYVSEEPLTLAQMASALGEPAEKIEAALRELMAEFEKPGHGIGIREVAGGFKMATKAEHHDAVRSFVKSLKPPLKLSLPALETLAVIAYKQPVTGPEIMDIRGVQGGGVFKTLLDRKLIAAAGRKNVIGKPMLYKTTKEFLIQFGLKDLSELPSLKEFEEIRRMAFSDVEPPAGTEVEVAAEAEGEAAEGAPETSAVAEDGETPSTDSAGESAEASGAAVAAETETSAGAETAPEANAEEAPEHPAQAHTEAESESSASEPASSGQNAES